VGDWVRCERKKGEVLAVKYCRLTPTLFPLLARAFSFWLCYVSSIATVDSERDLRGEVTAITDNYSPLSSPF
jgi:hypothetical protein